MEVDMDILIDNGFNLYKYDQYSGCSSTSTIEDEHNDGYTYLSEWHPAINWDPLCSDTDIFHGLIDSLMMCDNNTTDDINHQDPPSFSTTASEGSPPPVTEGDDRGLRLVHLLIAAAEALKGAHKSRELASVILVRLKELVSPSGGSRTNMERLAAYFTEALRCLLDVPSSASKSHKGDQHQQMHPTNGLAAYQLLQDMSPCVKFGHFTANQAILESISTGRRVHIVDYDIMEGAQWASLMQAMVSKKEGPPPPHLRITAITRYNSSCRKQASSVQETGRRLTAFAASIGLPFSFGQCRLDSDEKFRPASVKVIKGETVIVNCMLHSPQIPHRSAISIASFLTGAATIGAKLITLVEEEYETRNNDDENAFVATFMDELHRYSAIWDSLEAGFPMQVKARELVEKVILAPRICSAVARAYNLNEEELDKEYGWGDWLSKGGFCRIGISSFNHCQARLLLDLYNSGHRVEEYALNKLVLSWKLRRLMSVSVWSPPPQSTTSGYSS